MKKILMFVLMGLLGMGAYSATLSFSTGDAELDVNLGEINVQAKADIGGFSAELSVSSGVSEKEITTLITVEKMEPADVYMAVEIAGIQKITVEKVVESYKKNKGKGWGVIAKELGIKPGSKEFKELKDKAKSKKEKKNKKTKNNEKKEKNNNSSFAVRI